MLTLLLSTRNAHKVQEIQDVLAAGFHYLTLSDMAGAPSVTEDAETFSGNAVKKSVTLANWILDSPSSALLSAGNPERNQLFVLADDSGLEVDALDGAPGVHSARFSYLGTPKCGNAPDAENNSKLLRLMAPIPEGKRTARFRCVLALTPLSTELRSNKAEAFGTQIFEGICEGKIGFAPRGIVGFGYDPLFIPRGFDRSFAEMSENEKNSISHRAQALQKLKARFDFNMDH